MSGGVDSAVAAALVLESGEEVVGLHMDLGLEAGGGLASAGKVARHLGIELRTVDLRETFRLEVVEPFVDIYGRGMTPNPCAICNREVKFKELLAKAESLGARALATAHYARLDLDLSPPALLRGLAGDKEQSYFLARLKSEWLPRLRFPLGGLTKDRVRRMARARGLPPAARKGSQEACFLEGRGYREFFESERESRPGQIVDQEGRVIGRHQGLFAYTVGQRRGLGLPAKRPFYVLALDGINNRLMVGPQEALFKEKALVRAVSWLVGPQDLPRKGVEVQVRYRARPVPAELRLLRNNLVRVRFREPQRAVAPGQLAAFYSGERVLGGGWLG